MGEIQLKKRNENQLALTSGVIWASSSDRGAGGGPYFGLMKGRE
jgi:hypothetical protein